MNALVNRVQLIGRMGAAIEIRTTTTGKKVGNVSIATKEIGRNAQGEKTEDTQWHKLVVWEKNAELLEKYTQKGSEIMIEGKLKHSNYEVNGEKRYSTEVEVKEIVLMGKKQD